jgi:hypothetical protein
MYTTLFFLCKVPGMSTAEFIEYYEKHHVPLVNSIVGSENMPLVYKRRYTHLDDANYVRLHATKSASGDSIAGEGETVDFDVVTELGFASFEKWEAWVAALQKAGNVVTEDEDKLFDRARMRAHVVEEFVTCG